MLARSLTSTWCRSKVAGSPALAERWMDTETFGMTTDLTEEGAELASVFGSAKNPESMASESVKFVFYFD